MANPARKYDERPGSAPRAVDPLSPVPPSADPVAESRFAAANDPRIDNNTVIQSRGAGNGVLIAALVVVLAVIAYFIFAPGTPETTVPADQPATTSEPVTPAPDATAPAPAPDATAPAPAPDATAPTTPATPETPAPDATAPAAPAPESNAPAAPAPAEPTPAPAQ